MWINVYVYVCLCISKTCTCISLYVYAQSHPYGTISKESAQDICRLAAACELLHLLSRCHHKLKVIWIQEVQTCRYAAMHGSLKMFEAVSSTLHIAQEYDMISTQLGALAVKRQGHAPIWHLLSRSISPNCNHDWSCNTCKTVTTLWSNVAKKLPCTLW